MLTGLKTFDDLQPSESREWVESTAVVITIDYPDMTLLLEGQPNTAPAPDMEVAKKMPTTWTRR